MKIINRITAKHYKWKDECDGWYYSDRSELSIIAEKMPPNTAEDMHFHKRSKQFFYILSGQAIMRFLSGEITLNAGDGVEIEPNEAHRMVNASGSDLEFLVISMPESHGDKYLV